MPAELGGCKGPTTPTDVADAAGTITAVGGSFCTWLEGVTGSQAVVGICATVEEIGLIVGILAPILATTPADPDAGPCTILPGTTICATREQLGPAIMAVVAKRERLLLLDAGPGLMRR